MEGSYEAGEAKSLSGQVGENINMKNIDRMIELSRGKKKYLNEVLELTRNQRKFIDDEDMDGLNHIISSKEKLMGSIDILDLEFLKLYKNIMEEENVDSLEDINLEKYTNFKDLKKIVTDINTILNNITSIDNENTRVMKDNLENIKSGLKQIKKVKKAYKGYGYEMADSILIDEKK